MYELVASQLQSLLPLLGACVCLPGVQRAHYPALCPLCLLPLSFRLDYAGLWRSLIFAVRPGRRTGSVGFTGESFDKATRHKAERAWRAEGC